MSRGWLHAWILLVTLCACTPRPSPDACEAMVAHLIELTRNAHEGRAAEIAAEVTVAHRTALRARCIEEGTEREVSCVLTADSLDAIHECAP
jgi:hypothetical protein